MKLIIQIPCLNEEETLPQVISELPNNIPGIKEIEYLVIDDGSTDNTIAVAKLLGVHHILGLGSNRGLAAAFKKGVDYAVEHGADILVNTDGDNQYCGADIAALVKPIIEGEADIVVGCRPINDHPEFGFIKKKLQFIGSYFLRLLSKTKVKDAASGFRAFSRESCQKIFIHTKFSYCIETLIQAGNIGLRVSSVDIRVNPKTRDSRLFKSILQYLWKTGSTMLSMFILYRPGRFFLSIAIPFLLVAFVLGLRYIYLVYFVNDVFPEKTYLPSLILLSILSLFGALLIALGFIAELIKAQRRLTEETIFLIKSNNCDNNND